VNVAWWLGVWVGVVALGALFPRRPGTGADRLVRHSRLPAPSGAGAMPATRRARFVRRWDPDLIPDQLLGQVLASLLEAGAPPAQALGRLASRLAAEADPRAGGWFAAQARLQDPSGDRGALPARAWTGEPFVGALCEALTLAARTGSPPAQLVRDCVHTARRAQAATVARRLARLPVLLVLPLGTCLLPAALLLGVVPVVLGLLGAL
jgi:hypothetical protein